MKVRIVSGGLGSNTHVYDEGGDEIAVIDKHTNTDLTTSVLAQIIFEEERLNPKLPADQLHTIIREGLK